VKTIAIIGHTGTVGKQLYKWFTHKIAPKYKVMGLSLDKQTHNWKEVNKEADYIFVVVPTPYNWKKDKIDTSIVEGVLRKIGKKKIVIIKSTVPPGTTKKLQEVFPHLYLFFNPEFLSGATAWEDFINPDRQLMGYTKKSRSLATKVLHLLPESPYGVIMRAREAETVKYINNFHGALMVIFANFFYDICLEIRANFTTVKRASQASKWVGSPMGRMYWDVYHKGKRGYKGACFPKDMATLEKWCKMNKIGHELLSTTIKVNEKLLKRPGLLKKNEPTKRINKTI